MLTQPFGKQPPTARVLLLKLHARGALGIGLREKLRALLFEVPGDLLGDTLEVLFMGFFGAIPGARCADRLDALGPAQASMQNGEAAHGQAYQMSPGQAGAVHDVENVIRRARLRVGRYVLGDFRRWKSARSEGQTLVTPREEAHLRLPAPVVAAELMDEDDWRAGSSRLIMQLHAIGCCRNCHGRILLFSLIKRPSAVRRSRRRL